MRGSMPSCGAIATNPAPASAPSAPPIVNNGASVPPEVPLPSAIDHEMNFITHRNASAPTARCPDTIASMFV